MAERRYVKEPGIIKCHCECSKYNYCPAPNDDPCKQAYKATLKEIKAKREAK